MATNESGAEIAARWSSRISGSQNKIVAGIDGVTESPMAKAAAKADKYQQGVIDSVSSGRYQAGLSRVTLTDWKNAMKTKGVPRMASGAKASEGKFASFMNALMPNVRNIQAEVHSMPSNTFEDRVQRMVANANAMHALKGQLTRK